ncbi:hypothetical protein ID741_002843 [Enterococcus sp. AZ103]
MNLDELKKAVDIVVGILTATTLLKKLLNKKDD